MKIPTGIPIYYQLERRKCGKRGCTTCSDGEGHGPYWYAHWIEQGRKKRAYIGKQLPESASMNMPTIVCLCGSTRFSQAFHEANLRETLAGRIVLSIGCDFKSDTDLLLAGELTPEDKIRLDELHLRKIDLADEILVLNVGGYIGESTAREIRYAREHEKPIRWLEEVRG